jgi:hypothetical protein
VTVPLGNGDGTFQPAVQSAVDIAPASVTTTDFNGDGKIDLAVAGAAALIWQTQQPSGTASSLFRSVT